MCYVVLFDQSIPIAVLVPGTASREPHEVALMTSALFDCFMKIT